MSRTPFTEVRCDAKIAGDCRHLLMVLDDSQFAVQEAMERAGWEYNNADGSDTCPPCLRRQKK